MKIPLKIRYVIMSFSQFKKDINLLSRYKDEFVEFKVKLNFTNTITKPEKTVTQSKKLKDILMEGIKKIEDKDVRKLLEEVIE